MTFSPDTMRLAAYEAMVMDNPRKPGEGFTDYIVRIAELVAAGPLKVKDMPSEARLPYAQEKE